MEKADYDGSDEEYKPDNDDLSSLPSSSEEEEKGITTKEEKELIGAKEEGNKNIKVKTVFN